MSGSTVAQGTKQRDTEGTDLRLRKSSSQPTMSHPYADVLALHKAVGNHAFAAAVHGNAADLPASVRNVLNSKDQPTKLAQVPGDFSRIPMHAPDNGAESLPPVVQAVVQTSGLPL